ncbi:unnamed protein product, partial [Mesorhabditis spiculigera]
MSLTIEGSTGKPFNESLISYLQHFGLDNKQIKATTARRIQFSKVVFAMYSSSNHFGESRYTLHEFRKRFNNTIIYYDLGLHVAQRREVSGVCNLFIRHLNFSHYPAHVKRLHSYAFKVVIAAEMLRDFDAFWMVDTSAPDFLMGQKVGKQLNYTHKGMFEYLPFPGKYHDDVQREAVLFLRRSAVSKTAMKWLLLCALTKECIAPPGSTVVCMKKGVSGCHRYDQSASNLIRAMLLRPNPRHFNYLHRCAKVERGLWRKEPLAKGLCE